MAFSKPIFNSPILAGSTDAGGRSENRASGGPAGRRIFLTRLFGYFWGNAKSNENDSKERTRFFHRSMNINTHKKSKSSDLRWSVKRHYDFIGSGRSENRELLAENGEYTEKNMKIKALSFCFNGIYLRKLKFFFYLPTMGPLSVVPMGLACIFII